ncbi:MAG TPA: polysaccharide biosynthesis/export family protein [Humisphaera sp.]|nr:polysaccharide biosynthesis/export family protein [Humisphaera sp.]
MKARIVLMCVMACMLCGCHMFDAKSTPNAVGPNGVFQNAGEHGVTNRIYRIDPPDEITLRAPRIPELDGAKRVVQPNGKIPLPLLGEVSITGLTPDEAAAYLQQLASKYYIKPDIHMEVVAQSKFYYIFGIGANKTGKQAYNGRVTVVSALAEAGFNLTSWPEQVHISRPARDGNANATVVVDFTKVWDYGDLSQNYLLEEGDIIYLPVTPLAAWSIATSQLLAPILNTTALVTVGGQIVKPGSGGL